MVKPEGDKCDGGSWASLIVLRARESRVHGEEARQVEVLVRRNIPCTQRQGKDVHKLDQIMEKHSMSATRGARCGKPHGGFYEGGQAQGASTARPVPTHHLAV
jgi:hypothetical protein